MSAATTGFRITVRGRRIYLIDVEPTSDPGISAASATSSERGGMTLLIRELAAHGGAAIVPAGPLGQREGLPAEGEAGSGVNRHPTTGPVVGPVVNPSRQAGPVLCRLRPAGPPSTSP